MFLSRRQLAALLDSQTAQLKAIINQGIQEILKQMATNQDAVQAAAAAIETNFAATKTALDSIATGVTALDAKIQSLAAQLAAGGTLSAADQAALTQLQTDSAALATQAQGINTAPPA